MVIVNTWSLENQKLMPNQLRNIRLILWSRINSAWVWMQWKKTSSECDAGSDCCSAKRLRRRYCTNRKLRMSCGSCGLLSRFRFFYCHPVGKILHSMVGLRPRRRASRDARWLGVSWDLPYSKCQKPNHNLAPSVASNWLRWTLNAPIACSISVLTDIPELIWHKFLIFKRSCIYNHHTVAIHYCLLYFYSKLFLIFSSQT